MIKLTASLPKYKLYPTKDFIFKINIGKCVVLELEKPTPKDNFYEIKNEKKIYQLEK